VSQMTDSRGFRSGAALSVLLLGAAALLHANQPTGGASALLVALIAGAMLLSAATGLRISLLGLPFRVLRARGFIGAPESGHLQPVPGLRLAQVMGGTMLLLGVIAHALFSADAVAIALVVIVATLQSFLAITGICVACKLYGVVVWFQNRNLPNGGPTIAPQKIRIIKGSGR
jgi:hypothetical protein